MNSIKKNFLYNSFYQILAIIIPLITTQYISRVLGATNIGIYSYNYSIAQFFVIFIMLGLNNYGNREIASHRTKVNDTSKCFWSIYKMQFYIGIIINIVYFIYCILIPKNKIISMIMIFYLLSALMDINWFFFGMELFKYTTIRNTIIKVLTTVSIFIFVKSSSDLWKYCFIMSFSMLISNLFLWPYILKKIRYYNASFKEMSVHVKPNLVLFLTVIAVSIYKIMDKIMLGIMSNKSEVGFYESSERVILIPIAFVTALGNVMLPRITNMISSGDDSNTKKMLNKSIALAMFLSTSMSFGIMAVAKEFVPLFYGKGFETCIYLYLILLPSCVFLAFGNVIRMQVLLPMKLDRIYVESAFGGAFVNVIINFCLINNYGSVGAAWGTLFAEGFVCVYQIYKIRKLINIKELIKTSIPFIVSGLIMFMVIWNMNIACVNVFCVLFVKIICGVIVYLLFSYIIRFFGCKFRSSKIRK